MMYVLHDEWPEEPPGQAVSSGCYIGVMLVALLASAVILSIGSGLATAVTSQSLLSYVCASLAVFGLLLFGRTFIGLADMARVIFGLAVMSGCFGFWLDLTVRMLTPFSMVPLILTPLLIGVSALPVLQVLRNQPAMFWYRVILPAYKAAALVLVAGITLLTFMSSDSLPTTIATLLGSLNGMRIVRQLALGMVMRRSILNAVRSVAGIFAAVVPDISHAGQRA